MGPVNYNSQFLIRTDKCILIETPPGDAFRKKEDQAEDKRRSRKAARNYKNTKGEGNARGAKVKGTLGNSCHWKTLLSYTLTGERRCCTSQCAWPPDGHRAQTPPRAAQLQKHRRRCTDRQRCGDSWWNSPSDGRAPPEGWGDASTGQRAISQQSGGASQVQDVSKRALFISSADISGEVTFKT